MGKWVALSQKPSSQQRSGKQRLPPWMGENTCKPYICEGVNIQTIKTPVQQKSNLMKIGLQGKNRSLGGKMLAL